jgi:hypothetical protein
MCGRTSLRIFGVNAGQSFTNDLNWCFGWITPGKRPCRHQLPNGWQFGSLVLVSPSKEIAFGLMESACWIANPKVVNQLASMDVSVFSRASGTQRLTGSSGSDARELTDSRPRPASDPSEITRADGPTERIVGFVTQLA